MIKWEYEVHYNIDYGFGLEHRWRMAVATSPDEAKKKVAYELKYKDEDDFSELEFIHVYSP